MAYKLLLADDSITIQKVVELTLSEEDFLVTAVGDGEAALETARKLMPDIILADVFMPKMDGYELCEKLKADPALKGVPVILLAGTFEAFDEDRALRVGAADHLTKPFESADLISKTKRLVETGITAVAEEALSAEPVEEAVMADEPAMAVQADTDDLWSVVDMGSEAQPLAGATETLTEDELWKRANLVVDSGETVSITKEREVERGIPWSDLPEEPLTAETTSDEPALAAEVETGEDFPEVVVDESLSDATAILNMEDLGVSWGNEGAVVAEPLDDSKTEKALPFVGIVPPPAPPAAARPPVAAAPPAARPSVSPDIVREEVQRAVREMLDGKIKEALAGISRDMIEQVVWEVVPDLAEEIIAREIEKLKAGTK